MPELSDDDREYVLGKLRAEYNDTVQDLVAILVEAALGDVNRLEARLAALEARLAALEATSTNGHA